MAAAAPRVLAPLNDNVLLIQAEAARNIAAAQEAVRRVMPRVAVLLIGAPGAGKTSIIGAEVGCMEARPAADGSMRIYPADAATAAALAAAGAELGHDAVVGSTGISAVACRDGRNVMVDFPGSWAATGDPGREIVNALAAQAAVGEMNTMKLALVVTEASLDEGRGSFLDQVLRVTQLFRGEAMPDCVSLVVTQSVGRFNVTQKLAAVLRTAGQAGAPVQLADARVRALLERLVHHPQRIAVVPLATAAVPFASDRHRDAVMACIEHAGVSGRMATFASLSPAATELVRRLVHAEGEGMRVALAQLGRVLTQQHEGAIVLAAARGVVTEEVATALKAHAAEAAGIMEAALAAAGAAAAADPAGAPSAFARAVAGAWRAVGGADDTLAGINAAAEALGFLKALVPDVELAVYMHAWHAALSAAPRRLRQLAAAVVVELSRVPVAYPSLPDIVVAEWHERRGLRLHVRRQLWQRRRQEGVDVHSATSFPFAEGAEGGWPAEGLLLDHGIKRIGPNIVNVGDPYEH